MKLTWYVRRLRAMRPAEIAGRLRGKFDEVYWRWRFYAFGTAPKPRFAAAAWRFSATLPAPSGEAPQEARRRLLVFADALLDSRWPTFALDRVDVTPGVDWHFDPKGGNDVPRDLYTFAIRTHGENPGFDTKYVWELSRHHHTTVLAMAYRLTGKDAYARAASEHVAAWIRANLFLHGMHWGSGIELGMRLIAFAWVRRLLQDWPEAKAQFEQDPDFARCIHRHQWLLARRMSAGSSANNHLIYEAAGLFIAANAFPWFAQSPRWGAIAKATLEREFVRQTFPSGYNRELASDYNGYVLEALLLCLAEGELTGNRMSERLWNLAGDIVATLADLADCKGHPPRQGDGDDARGLLVDAPDFDRWADLLDLGGNVFGRMPCGPRREGRTLRSWLLTPVLEAHHTAARPAGERRRACVLPDAGLAVLRARSGQPDEIYCAFDAAPHGYLSIASHAHADALSVELRYGGVPILVDPGTFSYAAAPEWRNYFRSTRAHNTLEMGGADQSVIGGPFIWTRHASARLLLTDGLDETAPVASVRGEHDGYEAAAFRGKHVRTLRLDRSASRLEIEDEVSVFARTRCRLTFHLHPAVSCVLEGAEAVLAWNTSGVQKFARMQLPSALAWRTRFGSDSPIEGWYSASYDRKEPSVVIVGEGDVEGREIFRTSIDLSASDC